MCKNSFFCKRWTVAFQSREYLGSRPRPRPSCVVRPWLPVSDPEPGVDGNIHTNWLGFFPQTEFVGVTGVWRTGERRGRQVGLGARWGAWLPHVPAPHQPLVILIAYWLTLTVA